MKQIIILVASALLASGSSATAQTSNEQPIDNLPARDDASLDKMLSDAERDRAEARANSLESRLALENWASCLARKNPGEAGRILAMDFTSPAYGRALKMLSREDRQCQSARGTLRAGGLLFAGEIAEALLEAGGDSIANRLAKAAASSATTAFSFTDRVSICVVRSVPGDVAALFATTRDSAEEAAALRALAVPMGLCAKAAEAKKPLSVSPSGLRAMLATAAFRSVKDS